MQVAWKGWAGMCSSFVYSIDHQIILPISTLAPSLSSAPPSAPMQSWRLMFTRRYSPQLVITVMVNMFQQWTGINAIVSNAFF